MTKYGDGYLAGIIIIKRQLQVTRLSISTEPVLKGVHFGGCKTMLLCNHGISETTQ